MSAVPQAVRRQALHAEQLAKEYRERLNGAPAPVPTDVPPAPAPAPENVVVPPAESAVPPVAPADDPWQRKYSVLQGKYNKEIPQLRGMVEELRSELTATRNLLASLSEQRQPTAAQVQPEQPPAPTRLINDAEVKQWGPDFVDMVQRIARQEQASLIPEVDRRLQPVNKRIDDVAAATRTTVKAVQQRNKESVLAHMDEQVPGWRELNEDPIFLEWLDQVDPFSGARRGDLLLDAFKAFDAKRVETFFTGYQKEHAAVTPPAPVPPTATAPATQVTLESMVAPGTPKPGAPRTPDGTDKKIWTRREISNFYREVNSGRFRGTAEQRKAIEADLFAAQNENRIRP